LEIEVGTAPLFSNGHTELDTDILSACLTKWSSWSALDRNGVNGTGKLGAEFALDFMFWPTPHRKYGWFVEPSYSYSFGSEHEQSLGVSFGLLIAIQ